MRHISGGNPLILLTGKMARGSRQDVIARLREAGRSVTTDAAAINYGDLVLVVGDFAIGRSPSRKVIRAEANGVPIVSERALEPLFGAGQLSQAGLNEYAVGVVNGTVQRLQRAQTAPTRVERRITLGEAIEAGVFALPSSAGLGF